MATTAAPRTSPPLKRPASVSASPPSTKSAITKGASARSAVPARVNSTVNNPARRLSVRSATPPSVNGPTNGAETKESLAAALKRETELKEQVRASLISLAGAHASA